MTQEKDKQEKPKEESPTNELQDAELDKVSGGAEPLGAVGARALKLNLTPAAGAFQPTPAAPISDIK